LLHHKLKSDLQNKSTANILVDKDTKTIKAG